MHRQYRDKERTYWEDRIFTHANEPKHLWATFKAPLSRRRDHAGSPSEESSFTADDFLAAYTTKILGVRHATKNVPAPLHPTTDCSLPALNEVTSGERCAASSSLLLPSRVNQTSTDLFTPEAHGCVAASFYDAV